MSGTNNVQVLTAAEAAELQRKLLELLRPYTGNAQRVGYVAHVLLETGLSTLLHNVKLSPTAVRAMFDAMLTQHTKGPAS